MKLLAMGIMIAILAVLGILLIAFEYRKTDVKKLVLIAVMTAMSIVGRFVFAALPGFKPVTALVVVTGMYLGYEAGFFCGALTALISNFYFGQGPWTPFQMFLWAMIGVVAAMLSKPLQNRRWVLLVYGVFAGIIYSLVMDLYSTIWMGGYFSWSLYVAMITSSLPYTIIYAVSNVFFLMVLAMPIGHKLEHVMQRPKPANG